MSRSNLTKAAAMALMRNGYAVTREHFSDDEYIYLDMFGVVRSEEGYDFTEWWEDIEPTIPSTSKYCWNVKELLEFTGAPYIHDCPFKACALNDGTGNCISTNRVQCEGIPTAFKE